MGGPCQKPKCEPVATHVSCYNCTLASVCVHSPFVAQGSCSRLLHYSSPAR